MNAIYNVIRIGFGADRIVSTYSTRIEAIKDAEEREKNAMNRNVLVYRVETVYTK